MGGRDTAAARGVLRIDLAQVVLATAEISRDVMGSMAKQHERSTHNWSEKQNMDRGREGKKETLCADGKCGGG